MNAFSSCRIRDFYDIEQVSLGGLWFRHRSFILQILFTTSRDCEWIKLTKNMSIVTVEMESIEEKKLRNTRRRGGCPSGPQAQGAGAKLGSGPPPISTVPFGCCTSDQSDADTRQIARMTTYHARLLMLGGMEVGEREVES